MVEGFAETVGEVTEVLTEGGGEGVAFGLEHQTLLVVLIEGLVDGGGAAVGREEEQADGRWRGLRDAVGLLLALVGFFFQPVLSLFLGAEVTEFVVDGLYKASAEAESAFSASGTGGDEKVEVGIDDHLGVDAGDVGKTGREDGKGAEDEHVCIGVRVVDLGDALQEEWQAAFDFGVEGGHGEFPIVSINSIISINGCFRRCVLGGGL